MKFNGALSTALALPQLTSSQLLIKSEPTLLLLPPTALDFSPSGGACGLLDHAHLEKALHWSESGGASKAGAAAAPLALSGN